MVEAPDHSAPSQLSRSRVLGLPYIVSEVNEPFPNDYAAEYFPILAAYALLQDWDGIFSYCYGAGLRAQRAPAWQGEAIPPFFPLHNDPVKMPQTAMGALLFLRGDVQAAQQVVPLHLTHERVLHSLRGAPPTDEFPYALPWVPGRLALVHRTGLANFHAEHLSPAEGELALPARAIVSDTGELTWQDDGGHGLVLVDAPCHQAIIGHVSSAAVTHLKLELTTPFAAVQLASLNGAPIAEADRLLLVTAARVANTGMAWTDATRRSLGGSWGSGPARIKPVTGWLTLRKLSGAQSVVLQPLDTRGQPAGPPLAAEGGSGEFTVQLPGTTPWCLLTIVRPA